MNSGRRDRLVSRWMDGDLAPGRATEVEADLERSEEARRVRTEFAEVGERLRGLPVPSGPAPEAAWADVRRAIRLEGGGAESRRPIEILVSRPVWAGGMMGVLGLGIIVGIWMWQGGGGQAMAAVPAVVESVETDLPGAMTMVYQDKDTGLTVIWVQETENREPVHAE